MRVYKAWEEAWGGSRPWIKKHQNWISGLLISLTEMSFPSLEHALNLVEWLYTGKVLVFA